VHLEKQFCYNSIFNFALKPKALQLSLKPDVNKWQIVYISGAAAIRGAI